MAVVGVFEIVTIILLWILSSQYISYSESVQMDHVIVVAQGSKDGGLGKSELELGRMSEKDGVNSANGLSHSKNEMAIEDISQEQGNYSQNKEDIRDPSQQLQSENQSRPSSEQSGWPFSSSEFDSERNTSTMPLREENSTDLQRGDYGISGEFGEAGGMASLPRATMLSFEASHRIRRRQPQPQEIFITKEKSDSFLDGKSRVRRARPLPNKGPIPLKDLNTAKFKNFRYRFPERTEWFPSYVEVWEMCVYKKGRRFEGIFGKNWKRKYCKWEEVYEIHKGHQEEGFSYEFASATIAYINCLRNDEDPNAKRDNCPKPCASNPCKGPYMSRCTERGNDVSKSYTCHCHPGWLYNSRTKKCDDVNVCRTSRELCSKTNTIECVEKEGYKHECVCGRKWMGPRCTKTYDACVDYDNPCGQYGKCTAHAGQRTWTCECMKGWGDDPKQEGRDCKRRDQVCDNVVCLNGGECQASRSQIKATCICSSEWTGDTCEKPMPTWTMWQPWSKCSVTCGYDGTRVRKRDCDHKDAVFCGPGTDEEHAVCNGPVCKVDGAWGEWIKVTDCSYNCGGGHYIQARNCEYETDDPEAFGKSCDGRAIVYADCNIMSCPRSEKRWLRVDINSLARTIVSQTDNAAGDWGAWNSWADCSTTCDVGFRSRNRICLSSIGACEGSAEEIEDCTVKHCDKEAGFLSWASWSYWTKCEKDKDFCYRYRECPYSTTDKEFREACPGKSSQSVPCDANGCGKLQEEQEEVKQVQVAAPQEVKAPLSNRGRDRAGAAGESSALGVGSVAALAGIGYMGKILFTKYKKKRKKEKQKEQEATV